MVAQQIAQNAHDVPQQHSLFADLDRERFAVMRTEAEQLLRAEAGQAVDVHIDLSILAVTIGLRTTVSGASSYMQAISWESLGIQVPSGSKLDHGAPALSTLPTEHRSALMAAVQAVRGAITPAYRFSWLDQWRFVPHAAVDVVLRRYRAAATRLEGAKDSILDDYDGIVATMRAQYTAELEARYTALARAGLAPAGRDAWVAQQLAMLMTAVPRADAISAVRARITKLNQRLASEALREYQASLEQRLEIDRLEMARRVAEAETAENLARLERERELRRELEREMRASAEAELREVVEPLKDARAQIAAMVVERIDAVVASLRREGALSAAASGSINAMVETFKLLDLSDGADDLAERIARIANVKDAYVEAAAANKGALAGALADLMDETRTVAYQAVRAVTRDLDDRLVALDL